MDICTDAPEDELTSILKRISLKFGDEAFTYNS